MVYEDLIRSMEESAAQKNRETHEAALRDAEEILRNAKAEGEEIRERYLRNRLKKAVVERNRQTYLTREEVKTAITREKERLFSEAFALAMDGLTGIRSSPGYQDIFSRLVRDAAGEIPEPDSVIHIDPRDRDVCREILETAGLNGSIAEDIETRGGARVTTRDGRITVDNTLESRLVRAKDIHALRIYHALTGE